MAYAAHTRFQFGGTLGPIAAPVEIWSCTFNTDLAVAPTSMAAEDVQAAISVYLTGMNGSLSSSVHQTFMKMSLCDNTNHVVGDPYLIEGALFSGVSDAIHPPQIALRQTLKGAGRGRSKFGGFYLPTLGQELDPVTLELEEDVSDAFAELTSILMQALEPSGGGAPVIASGVLGNVPVVEVRCGRALDTIRNRRNDLVEDYSVELLP
jgi:hypothetical protein